MKTIQQGYQPHRVRVWIGGLDRGHLDDVLGRRDGSLSLDLRLCQGSRALGAQKEERKGDVSCVWCHECVLCV